MIIAYLFVLLVFLVGCCLWKQDKPISFVFLLTAFYLFMKVNVSY